MEAKIGTTKRRGNKTKTLDKATLNQMRRSKKENETKHIVNKRGENEDENRRITETEKGDKSQTKRTGTKQKKNRKRGGEN